MAAVPDIHGTFHPVRVLLLVLVLLFAGMVSVAPSAADTGNAGEGGTIAVIERLGTTLPRDLLFRDEAGNPVRLTDLVTGPTVILPVYYRCTNVCSYQQARLAGTIQKIEQQPGKDYRIISLSFDATESPQLAARSKQTYLGGMKRPIPADGWRFLTGDADAIDRFTSAIGYRFQRQGSEFIHPVAAVVVSANGTITRYLYGTAILPKDLALALAEARSGVVGVSFHKLLDYCFSYDPAARTYVFNLLRVSATVVILAAGLFLLFLMLSGRKRATPDERNP